MTGGEAELLETDLPASGVPRTLPPKVKPFEGGAGGPSFLGSSGCFVGGVGADVKEKPEKGELPAFGCAGVEVVGAVVEDVPKEKEGVVLAIVAFGKLVADETEGDLSIFSLSVLYLDAMLISLSCKSRNASFSIRD